VIKSEQHNSRQEARGGAADTKRRILQAAIDLSRNSPEARLTVRAVAAEAGVGLGTLRYHFPTQRALLDAVLASVYEETFPDDRIRDAAVPAQQRLVETLGHVLAPIGSGDAAREVFTGIVRDYIGPDASESARAAYVAISAEAERQVESWLSILVAEGALIPGDNTARARFLLTVLNGLSMQRALPSKDPVLEIEQGVLRAAVHAVFA